MSAAGDEYHSRDWDAMEAQARDFLAPSVREYRALGMRTIDIIDRAIAAAGHSRRKFSEAPQVQAILLARIASDLRVVLRDAGDGYLSQAFTQASALFEHAHVAMYIGDDDDRARAWIKWDSIHRAFPGIKEQELLTIAVTAMSPDVYAPDAIKAEVRRRQRISWSFGAGKHGLPVWQHAIHTNESQVGLTVRMGPWADDKMVLLARLVIADAVEFALLGAMFFVGPHFTPEEGGELVAQIGTARQEERRLRDRDLRKPKAA